MTDDDDINMDDGTYMLPVPNYQSTLLMGPIL